MKGIAVDGGRTDMEIFIRYRTNALLVTCVTEVAQQLRVINALRKNSKTGTIAPKAEIDLGGNPLE